MHPALFGRVGRERCRRRDTGRGLGVTSSVAERVPSPPRSDDGRATLPTPPSRSRLIARDLRSETGPRRYPAPLHSQFAHPRPAPAALQLGIQAKFRWPHREFETSSAGSFADVKRWRRDFHASVRVGRAATYRVRGGRISCEWRRFPGVARASLSWSC